MSGMTHALVGPQGARSGVWLNSWQDAQAGLTTASSLMLLSDEGFFVCDYDKKRIRLYQGSSSEWDQRLMDTPSAIVSFRPVAGEPALVAVGAGPCLYIYKALKPYLKFSLPDCVCALCEIHTTDEKKTSRLIVGLENGTILLLDLHASAISRTFAVGSAPVSLQVHGILADYVIFAICRDHKVFRISSNEHNNKQPNVWIETPHAPISSCVTKSELVIASMGGHLTAFPSNAQYTPSFTHKLHAPIVGLQAFSSHNNAFVVGLANGEITTFVNHTLCRTLFLDTGLSALTLGGYARESDVLITVTKTGMVVTKILARGALDKPDSQDNSVALELPKKSAVFFELLDRERLNLKSMAVKYKTDMANLKALALEELITLHKEKKTNLKDSPEIKILGLGPEYRLLINLKAATSQTVTLSLSNVEEAAYTFTPKILIFKGNTDVKAAFNFELLDFQKLSGRPVKLTISRDNQVTLQTVINVPPSEQPLIMD